MIPLPSRFQLGDRVRARGKSGTVTGVCFRDGKVYYEVLGVMCDSVEVMEPMRLVDAESPAPQGASNQLPISGLADAATIKSGQPAPADAGVAEIAPPPEYLMENGSALTFVKTGEPPLLSVVPEALPPKGWKLVPEVPTQEMMEAGDRALQDPDDLLDVYLAMLDTAPLPQNGDAK